MSADETRIPSPVDKLPARQTLDAKVVSPGWQPRVHGYDVHGDLARHYGFAELMLTTLVGEAPTARCGARFSAALCFAAPVTVAEAPTHATIIARISGTHTGGLLMRAMISGTHTGGLLAVAAVALSEQSRHIVERHAELLAGLERSEGEGATPLALDAAASDDEERAAVERLRQLLRDQDAYTPLLDGDHTVLSAILTTLWSAGLRSPWQFEAVLCGARWPAVMAEAMTATPGALLDHPAHVPPIVFDPSAGPRPREATPDAEDPPRDER